MPSNTSTGRKYALSVRATAVTYQRWCCWRISIKWWIVLWAFLQLPIGGIIVSFTKRGSWAVVKQMCVLDSYFTEKYLGEPSKQPQTYDNADLTMRAGNLYNRQYLLIHGTADTVVIAQHSMMFSKALVEQDVIFQQLVRNFLTCSHLFLKWFSLGVPRWKTYV